MHRVYVIILTSYDQSYYQKFVQERQRQLVAYDIPYQIVSNGSLPAGYVVDPTVEMHFPELDGLKPQMLDKFHRAMTCLRERGTFINVDLVVRVNASTFVDVRELQKMDLPLESLATGFLWTKPSWIEERRGKNDFLSGTYMIFSADVARLIASDTFSYSNNKRLYETFADDVTLSWLLTDHGVKLKKLNTSGNHNNHLHIWHTTHKTFPDKPIVRLITRIKGPNEQVRSEIDPRLWKHCVDTVLKRDHL